MKVSTEFIVAEVVTTPPEEMQEVTDRIVELHATMAVIKTLLTLGKISEKTYRRMWRRLARKLGFSKTSIFSDIA